jgi:hypothetical protein
MFERMPEVDTPQQMRAEMYVRRREDSTIHAVMQLGDINRCNELDRFTMLAYHALRQRDALQRALVDAATHAPPPTVFDKVAAAAAGIRASPNEIDELRRTLAYDCARTDIESNCLGLRHGTEATNDPLVVRRLWNTAMATGGGAPDEPDRIARAIRYLDLCGLIKRQHHAPHIIQILDQPPPITG